MVADQARAASWRRRLRSAARASAGFAVFAATCAVATARAAQPTQAAGTPAASATCTDTAAVAYVAAFSPRTSGYIISRVHVRTDAACAGDRYDLRIQDRHRDRAHALGSLDRNGDATADVGAAGVDAGSVSVALVVTR
jgi:hypothetical protein